MGEVAVVVDALDHPSLFFHNRTNQLDPRNHDDHIWLEMADGLFFSRDYILE